MKNVGDVLFERMHYSIICMMFISKDGDYDTMYLTTVIKILCIQRRCLVPRAYRVVSRRITYI